MAYSVQLYLDAQTEALVRQVWDRLAEKGVSDNMIKKGGRPHVGLSVFDDADPGEISYRLRQLCKQQRSVEARFEHLGTYCSKDGVLFLVPVVSPRFFLLHSTVYKLLNDSIQGIREGCKPNRFVPHLTVAYGLDKETLSKTVSLFGNKALPIVGNFEKIALVNLATMEDQCVYPFIKES
jgi:2'-5' RNA ligase